MLTLHYWPTPNAHKITLFLEEAAVPFRIERVDITQGAQFDPSFLKIAPNNRMPAIVDAAPVGGGDPFALFESGAILLYLAEKHGQFLPSDLRGRHTTLQWLFWQMAGLGPMLGQNHHFNVYAPEKIPYAIERYVKETARLYGVLDKQLSQHAFVAGNDYTIADMACYPWIVPHKRQQMALDNFPHLKRWFDAIRERPATVRAYAYGDFYTPPAQMTEETRRILFGTK